jgi:hypothetical protein
MCRINITVKKVRRTVFASESYWEQNAKVLYFFLDLHIFIIQYSSRLSSKAGPDLAGW